MGSRNLYNRLHNNHVEVIARLTNGVVDFTAIIYKTTVSRETQSDLFVLYPTIVYDS